MISVIDDELKFYDQINPNQELALAEFKVPILAKISVSGLKHYLNDSDNVLHLKQIPHLKIKDTLYQLGKAYNF